MSRRWIILVVFIFAFLRLEVEAAKRKKLVPTPVLKPYVAVYRCANPTTPSVTPEVILGEECHDGFYVSPVEETPGQWKVVLSRCKTAKQAKTSLELGKCLETPFFNADDLPWFQVILSDGKQKPTTKELQAAGVKPDKAVVMLAQHPHENKKKSKGKKGNAEEMVLPPPPPECNECKLSLLKLWKDWLDEGKNPKPRRLCSNTGDYLEKFCLGFYGINPAITYVKSPEVQACMKNTYEFCYDGLQNDFFARGPWDRRVKKMQSSETTVKRLIHNICANQGRCGPHAISTPSSCFWRVEFDELDKEKCRRPRFHARYLHALKNNPHLLV